jgi:hypothetical protein
MHAFDTHTWNVLVCTHAYAHGCFLPWPMHIPPTYTYTYRGIGLERVPLGTRQRSGKPRCRSRQQTHTRSLGSYGNLGAGGAPCMNMRLRVVLLVYQARTDGSSSRSVHTQFTMFLSSSKTCIACQKPCARHRAFQKFGSSARRIRPS